MSCRITCLGKPGSTHNFIINGRNFFFKGGNTRTVDESVGKALKNITHRGALLFSIVYDDVEPEAPKVVEPVTPPIKPEPVVVEEVKEEVPLKVEEKPEILVEKPKMITKVSKPRKPSKKKQAALVKEDNGA